MNEKTPDVWVQEATDFLEWALSIAEMKIEDFYLGEN